jgi:hypothetical protein
LFYLISFGVVATATAVAFFGISFFLLAHPDVELIAAARDRGVEVAPQRADLVSAGCRHRPQCPTRQGETAWDFLARRLDISLTACE